MADGTKTVTTTYSWMQDYNVDGTLNPNSGSFRPMQKTVVKEYTTIKENSKDAKD